MDRLLRLGKPLVIAAGWVIHEFEIVIKRLRMGVIHVRAVSSAAHGRTFGADLDEDVAVVVVVRVASNPSPLRLPIQPRTKGAIVNPIVANDDVDRGMQFDPADLVAVELALERNVVDVVVLNDRENAPEVSDNAGLTTIEDGVSTDDV